MFLRVRIHFSVSYFADLIHTVFIINDGVLHAHGIAAGRNCCHCGKDTGDHLGIHILIQESAAGSPVYNQPLHIFTHLFRSRRKRIFRFLFKDGNRTLRTYRQTVLAPPASTPAEALKLFHLRIAIRTEFDHHAGAGIDTFAAFDAFGFINSEFRLLLHSHLYYASSIFAILLTGVFSTPVPKSSCTPGIRSCNRRLRPATGKQIPHRDTCGRVENFVYRI